MNMEQRAQEMVERYGEVVSFTQAAKIINRHPNTVRIMLNDGRLEEACAGTRVDVRSIARYICEPKLIDRKTRIIKKGGLGKWVV